MKRRVGLVGCGWISAYQIEGWRLVPGVEVAGVCDLDADRARHLAARFDIGWAGTDAVRMMEECRLDVVDIATTPESHKPLALAAFERGRHVLCQKPAALSLTDAREMIESAECHGVCLYVNEMLRFCPWFLKSREIIEDGRLGRLVHVRFFDRSPALLAVGPEGHTAFGFREFLKAQERGIVMEQTIHYLDVARFLLGEPGSVYCTTGRVSEAIRGEDSANIVLRYDATTVLIEDSWSAAGPPRSGMEIEGSRGSLSLSHSRLLQFYSIASGKVEAEWDYSDKTWAERRGEVFAELFADFLATLDRNTELTAQARDNLRTLELTLAAYDSAAGGRVSTPTFAPCAPPA